MNKLWVCGGRKNGPGVCGGRKNGPGLKGVYVRACVRVGRGMRIKMIDVQLTYFQMRTRSRRHVRERIGPFNKQQTRRATKDNLGQHLVCASVSYKPFVNSLLDCVQLSFGALEVPN